MVRVILFKTAFGGIVNIPQNVLIHGCPERDIAARIKAAQKTIKEVERRVKVAIDEFGRSLETIVSSMNQTR